MAINAEKLSAVVAALDRAANKVMVAVFGIRRSTLLLKAPRQIYP